MLCPVGTELWRLGEEAGLRLIAEAFVDRAYTPEGLLQPRSEPNALLTDPDQAAARAVQMVKEGHLTAVDGSEVSVTAEALLVHCDTPAPSSSPVRRARRWKARESRSFPSGDARRLPTRHTTLR